MDEKDRRYKVMTETTMGWTLIADEAQNLRAGVQRHPSKQGECPATSE